MIELVFICYANLDEIVANRSWFRSKDPQSFHLYYGDPRRFFTDYDICVNIGR